jgi:hypothetical protein
MDRPVPRRWRPRGASPARAGPAAEIGDDQARAQAPGLAAQRFEVRGGPFIGLDIARELLAHAGPQHLDRHLAPIERPGLMHLGDRGGADRILVETREQAFERALEARLDLAADQREIDRGSLS